MAMGKGHFRKTAGRGWLSLAGIALMAGCHSSQTPGSSLPTTSPQSVALPGAVNTADAPHAPSVAESQAANLVQFRDAAHGVSFAYPEVWRPPQLGTGGPGTAPPAFAAAGVRPLMTQVFATAGTPLAQTVLESMSFSYGVQPHGSAAACAQLPTRALPGAGQAIEKTYNGVAYSEVTGGDAGACHQRNATVDTAMQGVHCVVFERDVATVCPDVKNDQQPRPLTPAERQSLAGHLNAIMQSVRLEASGR